ncbi:putative transporter SEO1 [Wickerhamomyces ciferrii]|uniref:Transporter SEO1 n=1 Tax=Wickerhamomyces ciferrii (strain ATCC 14091 / BCRC 22168 / CBS 111 / JCM 3599 / NBRC 0793 / NRRL Y-1031 F-60-10) TaxID=1206466 RepID=K0KLM1_WICCF|nr:putative transporter SEO1 [Wickerhamomyces ciferrii]CCH42244.1 putative transporter SEO1 [Wickerhamomyces ciferrii]
MSKLNTKTSVSLLKDDPDIRNYGTTQLDQYVSIDQLVADEDELEPFIDIDVRLTTNEFKRRSTTWYQFTKFVWDSADKHPHERSFMLKIDGFLMSSLMLGYFIKSLNGSNVSTAYVNGMKEHYNMKGNDYNLLNTLWSLGYLIGQLPASLLLQKLSPRHFLCLLELTWAGLTILLILPSNIQTIWILRFFIGLTESGYYPIAQYLIGSWYSSSELNKRSTLFSCAGTAAGLVSGPLQETILHSSFIINSNWKPFQWLFIFDASISVPIAIFTLFSIPNTPITTNAWYLTSRDKLVALERRRRIGAQISKPKAYTKSQLISYFFTWHVYVFPMLFFMFRLACMGGSGQGFTLWMKLDLKLPSSRYNIFPAILCAASIVYNLSTAFVNDYYKMRLTPWFLSLMFIAGVVSYGGLAYWDIPTKFKWFCFFFFNIADSCGQSMTFSWLNKNLAHDDMKRNFLLSMTNMVSYIFTTWLPLLLFNQDEAPRYHKGYTFVSIASGFGLVFVILTYTLIRRDDQEYFQKYGYTREERSYTQLSYDQDSESDQEEIQSDAELRSVKSTLDLGV